MSAPVGPRAEQAVQRLVHLVASKSLAHGQRLRAAHALVVLLQDGDPAAADRVADEVQRHQAPEVEAGQRSGMPARWRRLRAVGDVLDFLNPF